MKTCVAILIAGLLAGTASAVYAQTVSPGVSVKGDGRWEMFCRIIARSDSKQILLDRSHSAYSDPRLTLGECKYRAAPESELAISVIESEDCPFSGASAENCAMTVSAGKSGSFKFRAKRH